jgi:soluble lytic murein transglycosylase-like protein
MGNIIPESHYTGYILSAAKRYGVSSNLVAAVIMTESGFNANAISPKGAQGLMQLMPSTAARFGVSNPFDAKQNIDAGVKYLSELLTQFKSTRLAVAAYNAGAHAVEKYGNEIPPYAQTQAYVPIVMRYEKKYRSLAGNKKAARAT